MEQSAPLSDGEICKKFCADYLAMGMSLDEYWNGDAELCRYYRQANRYRREQANQDAWLHGFYVYTALINVSPLFRDWVKNHKPEPYFDKPIPLYEVPKEEKQQRETEAELEIQDKLKDWIVRANKIRKKKEVANG